MAAAALPLIGEGVGVLAGLFGGGGPSAADKQAQTDASQFMQTLQNSYNTQFANEQEAQNLVQNAMAPIINGGAYQYGFSTAEDQALQAEIENAGGQATENSVAAQQLREQQQTGGAEGAMPTGAQEAIEAQVRATGAQKTAAQLGQEKELGYQVGRENFQNAVGNEEKVAELANPTGYAGATNMSMENVLNANKLVDQMQGQSITSKILGGLSQGIGLIPNLNKNSNTSGSTTSDNGIPNI